MIVAKQRAGVLGAFGSDLGIGGRSADEDGG
jgi:hypothetical protein